MVRDRHELNYQPQDIHELMYKERMRGNIEAFVGYSFNNNLVKNIFDTHVCKKLKEWDLHYTVQNIGSTRLDEPIITQIVNKIDKSRVCIMDLTDQRHNVYFEAGIVFGRNIDLVLTCHDKEKMQIAFDTKQYEVILWNENSIDKFLIDIDMKLKRNLKR